MHYVPGGLSFPRLRACQCCCTPFVAQQMHDLHCSPVCQQAWKERLQILQRLPAFSVPRIDGVNSSNAQQGAEAG